MRGLGASTPRTSPARPPRSPIGSVRRSPVMPTETVPQQAGANDAAANRVIGMDVLELGPANAKSDLGRRTWQIFWPKVLAVAIVILVWQTVVWSHWRTDYALPGPQTVFTDLGHLVVTGDFWSGVRLTLTRAATG